MFNSSNPAGASFPLLEKDELLGSNCLEVVYSRGCSISIRYRIKNPNSVTLHVTFEFANPKYRRENYSNPEISLSGYSNVGFTLGPQAYQDVTVTVSGLPNYVTLGWLKTMINIVSEAGGLDSEEPSPEEFVYLVDANPVEPLKVPWTDVLYDACTWADGYSGAAACAYHCTFGLYCSQKIAYTLGTAGYPAYWVDIYGTFYLSKLLSASGWQSGNCVDVSCFLCICLAALGVNSTPIQLYSTRMYPPSLGFVTNPVCPIGSDPTQAWAYSTLGWVMHQVCHVDELVYDACLALWTDFAGNIYQNPPAGWSPDNHWQAPAGSQMYGLVKRYVHSPPDDISVLPQVINMLMSAEPVNRAEIGFEITSIE